MEAVVLCSHCGAPLSRQARWRAVECSYCSALNAAPVNSVSASAFRAAWQRAAGKGGDGRDEISVAGCRYAQRATLAFGEHARIVLADRLGALPERLIIKEALDGAPAGRLQREMEVLEQLHDPALQGAAHYSQRLQQVVAFAAGVPEEGSRGTLVLRVPPGFWGSLATVRMHQPCGIDPRHAVWMWRRILDMLAFAHAAGWAHGALYPAHLLVHPPDHGIVLIGWAGAARAAVGSAAMARDLQQAAWTMRALLAGAGAGADRDPPAIPATVPPRLATLLRRASEDQGWCASTGATGQDSLLVQAALDAFGAPAFVEFSPDPLS